MDSNKDEAFKCLRIAEELISSGNKHRALKFIKIAKRLNHNLDVDELLDACEKLGACSSEPNADSVKKSVSVKEYNGDKSNGALNGGRNYSEEHVQMVRQIKRTKDYYAILGVEKSCSEEDIRKAYRKLSLKVHPDKNKAPGSEEAFKKVCKAFKCLSDSDSRRKYDQVGLVDQFEYDQQHVCRQRRRRRTRNHVFDEDFDPDEIFRAFFRQGDLFRASHVYGARGMRGQRREEEEEPDVGGFNFMIFVQLLPFLIILLLAYLPFTEPEYSFSKNYSYQVPKTTEKHGVEYFVKSAHFDSNYPVGSPLRANFEDTVIKDYRSKLWRYCHVEMQRRQWSRNLPTPHCNKLHSLGLA